MTKHLAKFTALVTGFAIALFGANRVRAVAL